MQKYVADHLIQTPDVCNVYNCLYKLVSARWSHQDVRLLQIIHIYIYLLLFILYYIISYYITSIYFFAIFYYLYIYMRISKFNTLGRQVSLSSDHWCLDHLRSLRSCASLLAFVLWRVYQNREPANWGRCQTEILCLSHRFSRLLFGGTNTAFTQP